MEHKKRTERYAQIIQQIYDRVAQEASRKASLVDYDPTKPFSFADYPLTRREIEKLQAQLISEVSATIMSGTSAEWKEANLVQDLVAKKVLTAYTGTNRFGEEFTRYFQTNPDSLKAFQQRKDEGMNLSSRVWNLSEQYKAELEESITAAIAPGMPAMELAAQVKKYLNEPDKRFRRIKEKQEDGNFKWKLSKNAKAYHPGQGVYRSSARNAQRLAHTEINMAYRTAEQTRWKQFDFVVGYEVKTTQNGRHIPDICDDLAGKYPKSFIFRSWHPQCLCYCIPILKTEEEFWNYDEDNPEKSVNEVTVVPDNFKEWIKDNEERIEKATERGTLPYFIRDNQSKVTEILENPVTFSNDDSKSAEEKARIEANRKEYERLKADPNYKDVEFNPRNGGLKATHEYHQKHENDKTLYFGEFTSYELELRAQNILFTNGHSCIFESEVVYGKDNNMTRCLDTTTDGERVDIKSITKNGKNTLKNAIRDKKAQLREFNEINNTDFHTLILYYHDPSMFNEDKVRKLIGETFKKFICLLEPDKVIVIE